MTKPDVVGEFAEQRYSFSNQHRYSRNGQALHEPSAQELLNGDSTVDVKMMGAAGSELCNDLSRIPTHLFDGTACRGQVERSTTQDHDTLVSVWPGSER